MIQALPLTSVRLDGGTQPRASTDTRVTAQYAEAMVLGAKFPPVDVFFDGSDYWLADGFYRVHAAIGCGKSEIACTVHQGTLRDAILFSCGANATHGMHRSEKDTRRAVRSAIRDPGLPDDTWGLKAATGAPLSMIQAMKAEVRRRAIASAQRHNEEQGR